MIQNYFRVALRNIFRQKTYVFVNIFGLAIGISSFILITLFVLREQSYDNFNIKGDRIYNLVLDGKFSEQEFRGSFTSAPMAPAFKEEIPEIESVVRMNQRGSVVIRIDDQRFVEDDFVLADSSFFDIFSIPLIRGNEKKVLVAPNRVVLTQTTARKYFGEEDPLGKQIYVGTDTVPFEITGICEDVPENCHFTFNMLASFLSESRANDINWLSNSFPAYVLLAEGASKDQVEEKIKEVMLKHVGPQIKQLMGIELDQFKSAGGRYGVFLQPLHDIHLNPDIETAFKPANSKKYILIFSIVAILVMIIAVINYMNLATARSAGRAHEVGIRKVLGSTRAMLIRQFLLESILLSLLALALALVITELVLPLFNRMIRMDLDLPYLGHWFVIPSLLLFAVLVGMCSGSYPAVFLSSFRPIAVLTGKMSKGAKSGRFRSILVVIQMVISASIILCTIVIFHQLSFMLNKDLGYNKEQLLVMENVESLKTKIPVFCDRVRNLPGVLYCSHSTAVPGHVNNQNGFLIEGQPQEKLYLLATAWSDKDQLDAYRYELVQGRYFSDEMATDSMACVINESTVRQFGLKDPLQTRFYQPDESGNPIYLHVIGVLKDFHFMSLHEPIKPHIFLKDTKYSNWGYISIRMEAKNNSGVVKQVEDIWKEMTNEMPIQYFYMDEDYNNMYKEEKRTGNLALAFTLLSVFIAGLGLFGLSSFATEQRTREIGIRKSLGASPASIVLMLSKEVGLLIGIATLLAWPFSTLFLRNWLNNYSYRISLGVSDYLLSFLIVLLVSWITISFRSFQAARTNPSKALRHR